MLGYLKLTFLNSIETPLLILGTTDFCFLRIFCRLLPVLCNQYNISKLMRIFNSNKPLEIPLSASVNLSIACTKLLKSPTVIFSVQSIYAKNNINYNIADFCCRYCGFILIPYFHFTFFDRL